MKKYKEIFLKTLALLLCAAMLFSLAACGGKDESGKTDSESEEKTEGEESQASGFVYVAEYLDVNSENQNGFNPVAFTADSIYATSYEMIADNTPEGVTPTYEGEYWEYGTVLYKIGLDGSVAKVNYTPSQLPEGAEGSVNVNSVCLGEDGKLHLLEQVYTFTLEGMPETVEKYSDEYWNLYGQYYKEENIYRIRVLNPDGTEVACLDLENPVGEDGYFYPYNFQIDAEGNYYLPCDSFLYVFDSAGALKASIEAENWVDNVVKLKDGSVYANYYGSGGYELAPVDLAAQSFGEAIPLPSNVYYVLSGSGDYDVYYSNGTNFFGYDFETQQATKILNWINCDIDSNRVNNQSIHVADDGSITLLSSQWDNELQKSKTELVTLTKQPASSVPQKKIITLATQYLNWNIRSEIIEFNKNNGEYRIEVQDYSEYNTQEDYSAGLTKLTTEILSGQVPDILYLDGLPVEQLAVKGYLEDLYPYLDSDAELSREDIFPSVLTALEKDGKLYTTCDSFSVVTVMGASSVVGEEPGWTVDEYMAALATMPEGCTGFDQYAVREEMLRTSLQLDMGSFVNWETGECDFNNEAFVKLLEFANSFPAEFDWDNYEWTEEDDLPNRVSSGRQMLYSTHLYDFQEYQMYKAIFGGDVTFIGYPTEYGTGNMLNMNSGYAISSKCEYKDGAWQFLRQFFTEEYQEEYGWNGYPSNINAFNKKLEDATTPVYQTDAEGNFILDENGNKIEQSQGGWGWGSVEIEMYALSQEEADEILELINSTTKIYNNNDEIINLVVEVVAPYFEGQKSAEDVAKLVQSKISLYVNEQL